MTLVMKFGGTSVGSATAMRETAALVQNATRDWDEIVVVSSAMGTQPVKVTDLLLRGAQSAAAGDDETYKDIATALRMVHFEAIDALLEPEQERQQILAENNQFIDHYDALCQAVLVLGELSPRALDAISGMGEQMSTRILAAYLRQQGVPAEAVDATELIVTDDRFQAASPLLEATRVQSSERLRPMLADGIIPVVTGFIAASPDGITTTLGRGGSDYSAAILGQALSAREVWIWTDVDGIMTADPRLEPSATSIPVLSFREVAELAYYGARVLHPRTIRPCIDSDIPLRIKNTFQPDYPGTLILADSDEENHNVKAVTSIPGLSLITVEGRGMLGVQGIAARTFAAVARGQASVLLISQASSEQSICFAVEAIVSDEVIASLEEAFDRELARQDIDRVWALKPVAIVTAVGAGMRHTYGIAGRIFGALGDNGINIIAIAQGSSECSISMVVDESRASDAVSSIHTLI